ncbi:MULTISPECIES: phage/plasmid primase, P4 family [Arthrobacter]|uniref:Phage/plasmid primase, P4 family n=2 Tax=Arthrobacter TaxID=1663 RepID=A0ABU9KIY3_9MICC|nr:phage/plasmid primase, P4 family [Arthrobacter sp. YJM1]MDP5226910.1 phage/plasmid primase, P4 family [Arthrobacter sp. YJM1]
MVSDPDTPINEPDDPAPVFDDDLDVVEERPSNPLADVFDAAMRHFAAAGTALATSNEVVRVTTDLYLDAFDGRLPSPSTVEKQLLTIVNGVCKAENSKTKIATEKLPLLKCLASQQIAKILLRRHVIKEVVPHGMSETAGVGVLAIYQAEGPDRGIYRPAEFSGASSIERLVQEYNPSIDEKGFKEVKRLVRLYAERRPETVDQDLIPMDDVIYNYATDERIEYSPDYVFLAKFHTALPAARPDLPVIHDDRCEGGFWDIESWTEQMHPSEGMADYIWKVRCAMLRNRVNWKKAFLFYDPLGSTGKGTENELIRGLIGSDNCVSVPLSDFGKPFGTEPLVGALANIVDELAVGGYYRDLSDFKATVTHDRITINRKHKEAISYKPNMGSLFNLNEHIDASDKTGSLLRRFALIPFTQRFLGTTDNASIKEDYILRREVREYIAYKVLVDMPKFWDIAADEPPLMKQAMDEYRLESQSVAAWADECLDQFVGRMVAFAQAHAHYYAWTKERNPASKPVDQPQFTFDIKQLLDPDEWIVPAVTGKNGRVTDKQLVTRTWITEPEPLLDEFHYIDAVTKWQPHKAYPYKGDDGWELPKAAPRLTRGFVRRVAWESYEAGTAQPSDTPPCALDHTNAAATTTKED